MNLFDLVIVALVVAAAVGGYRLGFVTRVLSWIGMAIGLVIAVKILPSVLDRMRGATQLWVLFVALAILFGLAFAGQGIGFAIGHRVRPARRGEVTRVDGAFGALAGALGVIALVWLLLPMLAETRGWVAEQARSSAIAQAIDSRLPAAPDSMQALRSLVGEENFPTVFDALRPTPDVGPPPADSGLPAATTAKATRSVVRVEGIACDRIQDGTGWVAAPDLVVTNAHVVAGEDAITLQRDDGSNVKATAVAFDPRRDIAILRAPGIDRPPLPIADSERGDTGGVFGHPGGGPLRVAPFDIASIINAVGRDIYGTAPTNREVLELRSSLHPGDSGSALVDQKGNVVGVAFAIAPDRPTVAYALSIDELRPMLNGDLTHTVDTGPCTSG